jgi:polyphosphate kinase
LEAMEKREYESLIEPMEIELNNVMRWLQHSGRRMIVLFEGRDTAGKGGVIHAITHRLNPRQVRTVALAKPTERELGLWYFQRYVEHFPAAGEMVLFDRSWYNRAGVEKVMGFCTEPEYELFLKQAPAFETMLVDDGILLLKYWLSVDQQYQEERFAERAQDPLKRWKLSPTDFKAREAYEEYGRARDLMFAATHTQRAPWYVVNFDDQRRGRLNLIRHLLDQVPDDEVPEEPYELPQLPHEPLKERFTQPVQHVPDAF